MSEEKKCHWENCTEPAHYRARWRREKANGRDDAADFADYCSGHMFKAETIGAVRIETFEEKEAPSLVRNDALA
jgi:hypothetical protein